LPQVRATDLRAWRDAHRRDLLLAPVYAGLSLISLRLKLAAAPLWLTEHMVQKHQSLLAGTHPNNEQSRVLQWLVPEAIRAVTGASIPGAYAFVRWLFVFLAFVAFDAFLRPFLRPALRFGAVALLAALLSFTHRAELQESAPLLMLLFVLALDAIRGERRFAFAVLMLLGALTNETMLILPMGWALVRPPRVLSLATARSIGESALLAAPAFAAAGALRWWTRHAPHLGGAWHWPDNVGGILRGLRMSPLDWYRVPNLGLFFLFGALWIYPLIGLRAQPRFFQRMLLIVPPFLAAHLITGIIGETRQMIPLGFLLIPMSLRSIFGDDAIEEPAARGDA
jgi:hypothetical protein